MAAPMHPALALLLRLQLTGRVRRVSRTLLSRRRRLVSVLGVMLGVLWLGNAVVSMAFREPYAPDVFRRAVALGLLGYFLWHVLRVSAKRPENPIEWTPAEQHLLLGGPFSRRDVIVYRFGVVLTTTILKAACVSLLFLPELHFWWVGFVGAFLGFSFLEFLRLAVEFTACGVSRATYLKARVFILLSATAAGVHALIATLTASPETFRGPIAGWSLMRHFGHELVGLRETLIGRGLEAPFLVFARIVTIDEISGELALWLAGGTGLLLAAASLVYRLDEHFHARGYETEIAPQAARMAVRTWGPARSLLSCQRKMRSQEQTACQAARGALKQTRLRSRIGSIPRLGGIGPLAWRQFVGAGSHLHGLVLAMVAPTVLACLPLVLQLDPATTFINVVGSVGFYSFVLLPSALKFDFRRDYERLHVLKALPLRSTAVVLGQIAAPVILTTAYQAVVLAITYCVRPVPAGYMLTAMLCLVPANVLIYGLENILFLLSPHRMQQEGLEVFLKTTLTFTAKGLLFAMAAVIVFWWVFLAATLADLLAVDRRAVFVAGLAALSWLAAGAATALLARTYRYTDASLDPSG